MSIRDRTRQHSLGRVAAPAVAFMAWVLTFASCADPIVEPLSPPAADALAILFVGNSLTYSNDLPGMVKGLLEEADVGPTVVASSAFPNYGLQDHWIDGRTRAAIALGGWDYVVLQQGPSATEGRPSLLEYTLRFDEEIKAIGARSATLMVWPSNARSFDFDGVIESYAMAAASVDGVLFPAGAAWQEAWAADPDLPLYSSDGFHPSVEGSYLAALAVVFKLVGPDFQPSYEVNTPFVRRSLDPEMGATLSAAAKRAIELHPQGSP